ncbi:MAG: toprim domain-containing protein [Candidatus Micrarchaeaceae archaeon]
MKRETAQKKALLNVLETIREGIVVVEGLHDIAALAKLNVKAINFDLLPMIDKDALEEGTVYLMMDDDKGGHSKEEKAIKIILSINPNTRLDTFERDRLISILSITSIEEAYDKAIKIIRRDY